LAATVLITLPSATAFVLPSALAAPATANSKHYQTVNELKDHVNKTNAANKLKAIDKAKAVAKAQADARAKAEAERIERERVAAEAARIEAERVAAEQAAAAEQARQAEAQRQAQVAKTYAPAGAGCDWLSGVLAAHGLSAAEISAAIHIAEHESGCRQNATNPSGGACNVFQELPCGKWGGSSNVDAHIDGATAYANNRYGGWVGAWAAWQSKLWW
jgi:membrane protein involved in colicin uptake